MDTPHNPDPPTAGPTPAPTPARSLLVLDDDELIGMLVATIARLEGVPVQVCTRAADFLAALDAAPPSHVLLDLTLADTSGETMLQTLAQRGCGARVIVASGVDTLRLAEACALARQLGLDLAGSLRKPFRPAELRALLAS